MSPPHGYYDEAVRLLPYVVGMTNVQVADILHRAWPEKSRSWWSATVSMVRKRRRVA